MDFYYSSCGNGNNFSQYNKQEKDSGDKIALAQLFQ